MLSDQGQEESIVVLIDRNILSNMLIEAENCFQSETGGMLFGVIERSDSSTKITISKTYIPPVNASQRSQMYFEIDPDYARRVLQRERLPYLGNWHKHLGYGGPSRADHQQIKEFFVQNPHKDLVIAVVLDYKSQDEYDLIIEVYNRIRTSQENSGDFKTFVVPEHQIHFFTCESSSSPSDVLLGITDDQVNLIKNNLLESFNHSFDKSEIQEFSGSSPGERIISFPFDFQIIEKEVTRQVPLLVLVSIPPEFPDGQIYIDISSQDLSRNFTFDKQPANLLEEADLICPFFDLLKTRLEDDAPSFLSQPVWQIMNDSE